MRKPDVLELKTRLPVPTGNTSLDCRSFVKKQPLALGSIVALHLLAIWAPVLAAPAAPASHQRQEKAATKVEKKAAAKEYDGGLINQTVHIYGDQQLVISPIGVKSTNPRSTISFVLTPPYETITVYNKANKTYVLSPIKTFRAPMQKTLALFNNMIMSEAPMQKIGTGTANGVSIVKYQSTKGFKESQLKMRKIEKVPSSNPTVIDSQITEAFNLPPGASAGICKYYGLPITPGVPLTVDCKDTDGTPSNYIQSSRPYKVKVKAEDFALPAGYKQLKSIEEINQSDVTEDALQIFGH